MCIYLYAYLYSMNINMNDDSSVAIVFHSWKFCKIGHLILLVGIFFVCLSVSLSLNEIHMKMNRFS